MTARLVLTIKRFYFDQIASGAKRIEYRKLSPYYARLFKRKYSTVVFHFYKKQRLQCDVVKIRKVRKPKEFADSDYLTGNTVWAIYLKNPRLFERE